MANWIPGRAADSAPIEEKMESLGVPEESRNEVRRFAEFLRKLQAMREGRELSPFPEGMREWLLGEGR